MTKIQRKKSLLNGEHYYLAFAKFNETVMNRIKEHLKKKGISQTWLATQMDKSYTTINEYARNKRQPSIEDLYKIADILNVEIQELLIERTKL